MKRLLTLITAYVLLFAACASPAGPPEVSPPDWEITLWSPPFPALDKLPTNNSDNPPAYAPTLDVSLTTNAEDVQRVLALQLTTSWNAVNEKMEVIGGYESDSPHPLQLHPEDFADATLRLDRNGGIELHFSDNFPPHTVSVQRWPAECRQMIESVIDKGEPVVHMENKFGIVDNGQDYIYEVYAKWNAGSSRYSFTILSDPV